jgi:hypothetical protein
MICITVNKEVTLNYLSEELEVVGEWAMHLALLLAEKLVNAKTEDRYLWRKYKRRLM